MQRLHKALLSWLNFWLLKFFRKKLLTLKSEAEVVELLENYDKQVKGIKKELLRLCWSMRGGISYPELLEMSFQERELIGEIAKENIETTQKTKMPYF